MKRILGTLAAILAAMVLTISPAMAEEAVGLFPGCYHIGQDIPGAPSFDVQLLFDAPQHLVTGEGEITQAVNPPLDIKTELRGQYFIVPTLPQSLVAVKATGYPEVDFPPEGGPGPVILPNVELQMSLNDFQSGTASYKYREVYGGEFKDVGPVPVKSSPCFQ
ncbi:MAG: DUF1842 domain-containing protein [Xenococcaceae cyanobacterium]